MTIKDANEKVNNITDNLGMPIDPGIKQILVALWTSNIETTGSCEGHLDSGLPFPWVDIETPEPEGWEDSPRLQATWKTANDKQTAILRPWLNKFNQGKKYPFDLIPRGIYGAARLQPAGDDDHMSPELLPKFQKQMNDFADNLLENLRH